MSARIGAVNKLEVGPDDDLYVGEYDRALRIADPVGGLGEAPRLEADGPPEVCAAIGKWGAATQQAHFTTGATPPDLDALRTAIAGLDGEDELKEEFAKPYVDQERLAKNSTAGNLLRAYGDEHCNLFDGVLPVEPRQAMRFCATYAREWDKVDRLTATRPARGTSPRRRARRCCPPRSSRRTHRGPRAGRSRSTSSRDAPARSRIAGPRGSSTDGR